jgi:hypothetical protein
MGRMTEHLPGRNRSNQRPAAACARLLHEIEEDMAPPSS